MKISEDEIYDMSVKETETKSRESTIEQRFHPGFSCFFQDFLSRNSTTFQECYSQLAQGSKILESIKQPVLKVLRMKEIESNKKKEILAAKGEQFLYIYKNDLQKLESTTINSVALEGEETLVKLERKLNFYQEAKQKALEEKLTQIRLKKMNGALPKNEISQTNEAQKTELEKQKDGKPIV